jgi:hypothetical protein
VKLLEENEHSFISKQDFYYARLMKEKYCRITVDKEHESSEFSQKISTEYKSSVNRIYEIKGENIQCGECLFKPTGFKHKGNITTFLLFHIFTL